jgi:CO dehydrogenase/acetyl-CoA synthase beta subunit
MARFDDQVAAVEAYLARGKKQGRVRELDLLGVSPWPTARSFVLARDTALDLGSPAVGSVGFLVWAAPARSGPATDRVFLEGPDVADLARISHQNPVPFGQVIVVRGNFAADYNCYLELKQGLYDLALDGLTMRSMPSQNHLWCRVHADAVDRGFGLAHLGGGIIAGLRRLAFVHQVDVLFHTAGREALAFLAAIAADAGRVVGALVKRHEQEHAECDECEYADICDEREHGKGAPAP